MMPYRLLDRSDSLATLAIITVCRNALEDLKITAASVQSQSAYGIVHVVVDGGSTDGSAEWLRAHRDSFAVAVSEPDKGIYDAMNKAVNLCPNTNWIIFLNAGDAFHDAEVVTSLLSDLQREDVDFIFGGVEIREAGGPNRSKTYFPRIHATNEMPGCHQSCFVRASVMRQLKFDLDYKVAGDFEFWLRAKHKLGCKTAFIKRVVATIAPEGYSAQNEPTLRMEYTRAISDHLARRKAIAWLVKRKLRRWILSAQAFILQRVT